MDKFEMKTNKKLLAAFAVLAVAFVVLAAIPAVDADGANPTEITDFNGFTDALTNGGNYILKDDIAGTLDNAKVVSSDVSIDLNGKTIKLTGGNSITVVKSSFELKSTGDLGKLEYTGFATTSGVLCVDQNGVLILNHIFFTTDGSAVFPYGNASEVTIKDSLILAGAYAVGINNATVGTNIVNVEIDHSSLTTMGKSGVYQDNCTVLVNAYGVSCNIKNKSTLTGDRQTLFVRAGTATVENTQINFNNAFTGTISAAEGKWGTGNEVASAAVVVGDKGCDNAYPGTATLTLKGGEIKATSGTAVVTSTDANTRYELIIGNETATKVSIGSNSVSITGLKADETGFCISEGSVVITGSMTATDANSKIAQAEGDVVLKDLTITTGTLTIDKDVGVQGDLTVASRATLTVAQGAILTVDQGATLTNNGILTVDKGATFVKNGDTDGKINYATGSKVVVDGNEYTVYHYTSGGIDIQYGISCGDVFYTGAVIDEYDVSVLSISLDDEFQMTNKTFTLVSEMEGNNGWTEIRDARTYADALKIQLTFVKSGESGTASNITVNLKTDLIIKPAPLDIRFDVPDEYNGIPVGDFQKIQIDANGNIVGKVGYYNLANEMDGYYLVITAQVYDKEGNLVPDAHISTEGMVPVGDGKYMLFLGKTFDEARQKLDSRIGFTAECDPNYIVPESWIDLGGIQPVDVMSISAMGYQNILGAYFGELYETLEFVAKNDHPTQFEVTGKLLWKANYTGFSSDFNETRGWYIPFKMYNSDIDADFWKNSTADIQILKLKENVELDGEFVFRIVDINVDPVITLKDPNGFKTKYVLDISGIKFGSATGYGATKAEAEENMSWKGVKPEGLTENGSDVIEKTMFMIFNTSAYRGQKVIATATNITNGMNTSYSEEIQIGEDQNICIWYFSFNHQFKDGEPGVYELKVKAGDGTVAEDKEAMKGVRIFTSGFEEKAEDAKREINVYRSDIEDVADKTFYMIAGIYGYPSRTTITASMLNSNEFDIIMNPGTIGVNTISLSGECDERKYAFYFSFENGDQVSAMDNIYGLYNMRLMNGDDILESRDIQVVAKSWLEFSPYENYNESHNFGINLALVPSQTDPTKISLTGKLNCGHEGYYRFAVNWNDISGEHPNAVIKSKDSYTGQETNYKITANEYAVFGFSPEVVRTYEFTVDFDGEEPGYEPTTYTFTFDGEFAKRPYGIYLSDPFYGDEPLEFTLVNETPETDTSPSKKFMSLPSGPDGSKKFIGWQSENGKLYSAGAFVIISDDMDPNNDGKAVFTAVYADVETDVGAEFTVKFDGEVYGTYEAGEMLTLIPVPAGKIAWAVNGSVISGQYTVLRADADEENVISFESVAKVNGIQRTKYTMETSITADGAILHVSSPQTDPEYFNMNGAFYYQIVTSSGSKIVIPDGIYAFGSNYTDEVSVEYPGLIGKDCVIQFIVDYGKQTIVLAEYEYYASLGSYCQDAEDANFEMSISTDKDITDAADKTAYIVFEIDSPGDFVAECSIDGKTICSESFNITTAGDGERFVWYFTFDGPRNAVGVTPNDISNDYKEGAEYLITVKDASNMIIAATSFVIPSA